MFFEQGTPRGCCSGRWPLALADVDGGSGTQSTGLFVANSSTAASLSSLALPRSPHCCSRAMDDVISVGNA